MSENKTHKWLRLFQTSYFSTTRVNHPCISREQNPRTCTLLSADGMLFKVDAIHTDERKKCSPLFSTCTEEMSINQIYMKMREQNSFVPKQRIFCPPHVPRNVLSKKAFLSQTTSSPKEQIWREFTDILPFDCPQHSTGASCMERYWTTHSNWQKRQTFLFVKKVIIFHILGKKKNLYKSLSQVQASWTF